jgi:PAS domain S-box-containing protein
MTQHSTDVRLQYEQTLTVCLRRLLASDYDKDPLPEVLTDLLEAISISQIGLFKNFTSAEPKVCMRCTHQVGERNGSPMDNNTSEPDWPYQDGLQRWEKLLSQGQIINENVADLPLSEQKLLPSNASILVIPLEVAGQWYGFIRFIKVSEPQKFNANQLYLLQSATEFIGIFRSRSQPVNQSHALEKALDTLSVSEKRFRAIFNCAPIAITLVTPKGDYLQFNSHWLDMLGYTAIEMRLKNNFDLYYREDSFAIEMLMQDLKLSNIDNFRTEVRFNHKTGKVLWGDITVSAIRNSKNELDAVINIIIDCSEKKQIEDERDHLFNRSIDMQCVIGFDGFFKQLNSAWEHTLHHHRGNLLSAPFLSLVHPDDWLMTKSFFDRLLQGETQENFENRFQCQNQSYRWLSWNAYPRVDQKKIYAIIRDITERKHDEKALREAHERLLTILDSLGSQVYVVDMQSNEILYVNKDGQNTFVNVDNQCELSTRKPQLLCSTCSNEKLLDEKGEPYGMYSSEYRSKKTGKWFLIHDRAIRWVDERLARLQIATDITERKRTEVALQINERRYRAIVQDQTELICRYLPDGRISFVNEAYCRYFNKTEAELVGHHFTPFIFDTTQDKLRDLMDGLSRETPEIESELGMELDGNIRWQHWIVRSMFDDNSKLVEYQAVGRDITERKHAEDELRHAKEIAEAATRARSEFLANMSHEIRTPMNGIVGMTELLLRTTLTTQQYEYAEIIYQSTDALQTLINDILDFAKIEAGKLALEKAEFDLESAVFDVARLLSITAETKGYELIVRYAPSAPRHFIGDAGRLRQILTNLVGNAIKFTSKGHVLIDVECQVQTLESACMSFQIKDTGIGIPTEQLDTIFEEFTQADTSTTRQFGGTGLGLAISQQLVKMMNGEIGVKSKLGKGSTFTFTLPLPLAENFEKIEAVHNSQFTIHNSQLTEGGLEILRGTRILIVDDNPVNRRILEEQFGEMQVRACAVESAETALTALLEAARFDDPYWLAIIDYFMPDIDGKQLGQFIKQNQEIQDTILVMLSSAGIQQESFQVQQIGFAAHLVKPLPLYQFQRVLVALRETYNRSQNLEFITMASMNKFQFQNVQKIYPNMPVLLVEDNDVNRLVAMNMLEQLGCQVTQAENGLEALEKLEQQNFAVIFMDIQMPSMGGFEATAEIREREKERCTGKNVIIAMTANAMQGDAEQCIAAGMDDYIAKPITLDRIFDRLKKYCPSYQTHVIHEQLLKVGQSCALGFEKTLEPETFPVVANSVLPHPCALSKINKKVLVVEDNQASRMVATAVLEEYGYTVDVAENGWQAVDKCADNHYDLILMDIRMPVMDGVEATKLIRQSQSQQTPIIAITANHNYQEVKHYRLAGMNDCLGKPLNVPQLQLLIEKYSSHHKIKSGQGDCEESDTKKPLKSDATVSALKATSPKRNAPTVRALPFNEWAKRSVSF